MNFCHYSQYSRRFFSLLDSIVNMKFAFQNTVLELHTNDDGGVAATAAAAAAVTALKLCAC